MRIATFVCLILAMAGTAHAQKARVLVAPVNLVDSKSLPEMDKKEAAQQIALTVEVYIAQQFHAAGAEVVKAVPADKQLAALKEGLKTKNVRDILDVMEAVGDDASVDYVLYVQLNRWSQRDRSAGEMLNSPTMTAASQTKVEIRLWLYSRKDGMLFSDGSKLIEASADGSLIGSQKRGELSGNPQDLTLIIQHTNKRRMTYIGRAVWEAVKPFVAKIPLK